MYVWVSVSNQRIKYSGGAVHFLHWMTESCSLPVLCYCCACCPCADFNPGAIKVLVPFFLFPTDARQFCMVSKRHLGLQSPTPRFRYDCRIKGSLALTFPTKNWSRVNRSIFGRFDVIWKNFLNFKKLLMDDSCTYAELWMQCRLLVCCLATCLCHGDWSSPLLRATDHQFIYPKQIGYSYMI